MWSLSFCCYHSEAFFLALSIKAVCLKTELTSGESHMYLQMDKSVLYFNQSINFIINNHQRDTKVAKRMLFKTVAFAYGTYT